MTSSLLGAVVIAMVIQLVTGKWKFAAAFGIGYVYCAASLIGADRG